MTFYGRDHCSCVELHSALRSSRIESSFALLVKKKYYFSENTWNSDNFFFTCHAAFLDSI